MVGVACAESRSRFSEEISAFSESIFLYASLPTPTPTFRLMHRSLLSISSFACSKYSFVLLTSTSFALASVSFAALAGGDWLSNTSSPTALLEAETGEDTAVSEGEMSTWSDSFSTR